MLIEWEHQMKGIKLVGAQGWCSWRMWWINNGVTCAACNR